jgi:hypothetical protein
MFVVGWTILSDTRHSKDGQDCPSYKLRTPSVRLATTVLLTGEDFPQGRQKRCQDSFSVLSNKES